MLRVFTIVRLIVYQICVNFELAIPRKYILHTMYMHKTMEAIKIAGVENWF